jgi:hypothetical protein
MRKALLIRRVALLVVAVFAFHTSRFFLAADLTNFVCPHHVQRMEDSSQTDHGVMQQGSHRMPQSEQSHRGTQPRNDHSGLRCCCRHALDGLITTIALATPAEPAEVPLPDGLQGLSLATDLSILQNDLNPPFIPPRV